MPVIRMRSCRNPACRLMVQADSVCACGTPHGKSHKAAKVKAQGTDRYAWKRLRKQCVERDGCCASCGATSDLTAHHAGGYTPGVQVELSSLVCLCRRCHGRVSQRQSEQARAASEFDAARERQIREARRMGL
jgi:hypothetical protein